MLLFNPSHCKGGGRLLTDRSNLAKHYIGAVNMDQRNREKMALKNSKFSVQIDSTRRVGEWYGFIIRSVTDELKINHRPRLIRMARHLNERKSNELTALLTSIVYDVLNFNNDGNGIGNSNNNFVALCGDRASLNRCSFQGEAIRSIFPGSLFIDCHSHTLANCGKALDKACYLQDEFWQLHNAVFARGETAKFRFHEFHGKAMIDYSETRWFAKREAKDWILKILNTGNGYIKFFSQMCFRDVLPTTSINKMRNLICSQFWEEIEPGSKLLLLCLVLFNTSISYNHFTQMLFILLKWFIYYNFLLKWFLNFVYTMAECIYST